MLVGDGTLLIPAIEVGWRGEHVNVLDADRLYRGLITEDLRDVDEQALGLASTLPGNEPVIIETIPGDLAKVLGASGPGSGGVRAIEIFDGSPRGLTQSRAQHDAIVHLSDSVNLALVAGSDQRKLWVNPAFFRKGRCGTMTHDYVQASEALLSF